VRLIVTILWCLAALLWLPWALLILRLLIELASGTPWNASFYLKPALVICWPVHGIFGPWQLVSLWPVAALCACGMSALGWRLYWLDQDGIMPRSARMVGWSIVVPLLAPFIMYHDAKRRHIEREYELESAVEEARDQAEG
jgi:hypothetical protein